MGAYVDHDFEKGFLLDEERLRKIHEIIDVRIANFASPLVARYKVFRDDSFSYDTEDVGIVASEDNDDWRAITKLEIIAEHEDVFDFRLSFSSKGVVAEISGDDRDAVFLLFSDLRSYLNEQVLSVRMLSRDTVRLIGSISMAVLMFGLLFFMMANSAFENAEQVDQILSSNNVNEKLNLLIESQRRLSSFGDRWWLLALFPIVMVISLGGGEKIWRFFFPSNLFLFGQKKKAFDRKRAILSKVFWVVGVGLLVSAAASLIVWNVTS